MTIEQVASIRSRLWDAGFRPLSVQTGQKVPTGRDWTLRARQDPPECTTFAPVPHALNTGVLADGLRAIDLDIDIPDLAARCRAIVVDRLGEAPIRTRRDSPRCLILYRSADGEPPKLTIAGRLGKIEVLGRGQQFVAFGGHPGGAELEWFPDALGQEPREALPAVSEQALVELLNELAPLIEAEPIRAAPATNGHDHVPGEPQADPLRIAAALASIPNSGPPDWEAWNKVCMAIWAATGGTDVGWTLLQAWSSRNDAYDPAVARERWRHYFRSPPTTIGAGSIFFMAREAGRQEEPSKPVDGDAHGDLDGYTATPFTAASLGLLQSYDWVYRRMMVARYFCALGAPPGTGKSALIVIIALSIVTGRALLGGEAPQQGNAWIINLEDPRESVLKMLWACCEFYHIEPVSLEGRLFINSGRDRRLVVARMLDGVAVATPVVPSLTAECRRRAIRALFVDPVVDTHSLPENDNITMNDYCSIWNGLAESADLAVLLSMHFRKGGQAGDPDAFRGASAIIGKARSAVTLGAMSEAEATKLGISQEDRRWYLRMDNAKQNLSPPPTKADWLRLESVELVLGDSIQALRAWSPPSPWENFSMAQAVRALDAIEAGPSPGEFYTPSRAGRANLRWAGIAIVAAGDGGVTDGQASTILDQWLQSGLLVSGVYLSPGQRRERSCVRVEPGKLAEMRAASASETETPWDC